MKNLKINTKFIVCFGLILVLFLVSVIATCSGIAISKNGYQNFYEEEFVTVTTVQDVKTKLQEALKEMLLVVETTDGQDYTQRSQIINQNISDIRTSVETLSRDYKGDTTLLEQFLTLMTNNGSVREKLAARPAPVRYAVIYSLFLCTLIIGAYGVGYDSSQFIYNQF